MPKEFVPQAGPAGNYCSICHKKQWLRIARCDCIVFRLCFNCYPLDYVDKKCKICLGKVNFDIHSDLTEFK